MGVLSLFVSLATILAISLQVSGQHIPILIRQPFDRTEDSADSLCLSWRFGVETNSIRNWKLVPKVCGDYVAEYFKSGQYLEDSETVIYQALSYVKSLDLAGDGKDIWIFGVEEAALSNVDFFAKYGYGTERREYLPLMEYMKAAKSPALPDNLKLYRTLLNLGMKVVFLAERLEDVRNSTETNLKNVGYHTWEKIIFWDANLYKTRQEFKSAQRRELVESGYRIVGEIGSQWSDIVGTSLADRTFKLPNPMYYTP